VIAHSILPTEPTALIEFFGSMRGSIHVAFEEGTLRHCTCTLLVTGSEGLIVIDDVDPAGSRSATR
jgi:hypothetical protein